MTEEEQINKDREEFLAKIEEHLAKWLSEDSLKTNEAYRNHLAKLNEHFSVSEDHIKRVNQSLLDHEQTNKQILEDNQDFISVLRDIKHALVDIDKTLIVISKQLP